MLKVITAAAVALSLGGCVVATQPYYYHRPQPNVYVAPAPVYVPRYQPRCYLVDRHTPYGPRRERVCY